MPIYATSIHLLPKDPYNNINKIIQDFWWGENIETRKTHTIAQDIICQPKSKRGIGIRKTELFNKAFIVNAKQFWRIAQQQQSFIAKTMKSKYFPKARHIWETDRIPRNSTKMRRCNWKTKSTPLARAKWQVGMGGEYLAQGPPCGSHQGTTHKNVEM